MSNEDTDEQSELDTRQCSREPRNSRAHEAATNLIRAAIEINIDELVDLNAQEHARRQAELERFEAAVAEAAAGTASEVMLTPGYILFDGQSRNVPRTLNEMHARCRQVKTETSLLLAMQEFARVAYKRGCRP